MPTVLSVRPSWVHFSLRLPDFMDLTWKTFPDAKIRVRCAKTKGVLGSISCGSVKPTLHPWLAHRMFCNVGSGGTSTAVILIWTTQFLVTLLLRFKKIGIYAIRIDRIQPDSATHRFRSQESSRPVALEVNVEFTPVLSWRLARGRMLQLRAIFGRQLSPTTMMLSTSFRILLCPSRDDWTPMRLWLMPHLPEITRNPGRKCHHFWLELSFRKFRAV